VQVVFVSQEGIVIILGLGQGITAVALPGNNPLHGRRQQKGESAGSKRKNRYALPLSTPLRLLPVVLLAPHVLPSLAICAARHV
jgi:hypothetical protein